MSKEIRMNEEQNLLGDSGQPQQDSQLEIAFTTAIAEFALRHATLGEWEQAIAHWFYAEGARQGVKLLK